MRIVQLVTQQHGGPVDHAVDVACELARRGHESHLMGPGIGQPGPLTGRLQAAGVRCHDARMTGKADLAGARRLIAALGSVGPEVVHLQDRRAGLLGRAWRLRPGGGDTAALVYTVHGVADGLSDLVPGNARAARRRRRDSLYYLSTERWLQRAAPARIVAPSRAIADFAVGHMRLPAGVVDVVHNGVDPQRFHPCAAGDGAAVWLGVMAPVKRLPVLLEATSRVPGLSLRLIGDGPERAVAERAVAEFGLHGRVEFAGRSSDPAASLAGAGMFVLSSAAENCPLALLQAMACGVPVVATRVGGVPEVVRDGIDGLLVPPDDPAALAAALAELSGDAALRARLAAAARRRILSGWTLTSCVDGLLRTYHRALAS